VVTVDTLGEDQVDKARTAVLNCPEQAISITED
jgi:ferredoxin